MTVQAAAQPPRMRQGPRPLGLHLSTALTALLSSPSGLQPWRSGSLPWRPGLAEKAAELRSLADGVDADALRDAVDREVRRRIDRLLTGVERYRHHPYRRDLPDPPVVWTEGGSRLLDYGALNPKAAGAPVLFVPSLVNRHYILDLSAKKSLMRWLAAWGLRPYLIDWGAPGALERRFTLTDYIAGRLERVLDAVVAREGRAVPVAGYCMGGLLTTALALRRPREVAGLVLMATPWDFHAEDAAPARRAAAFFQPFGPLLEAWGELPVDVLQALFAQLDPMLALKKFSHFARMAPDSPAAEDFVALEDWLNDGIPLVAGVARDALAGWYGRNDPATGNWLVGGLPVEPARVSVPTLALIPERDRIVPPASAMVLARSIPGAQMFRPSLGHIGMVVSAGAEDGVWIPLAKWLNTLV
ncbi:alpha/beta fold hydrolase [Azospirillum sp. TSO22-1]|uniref:alpha/beta fold hydrolase n=1 Tax=Azospirillum sp. TSO22-1 TaxID=716789 RepID=UPI000D621E50|nr:alpha/beta fold hydrolase [Azospirillum sp. TSO22-1]PWC34881.1 poly-beta-hydroxybutyrate polymerase [Azospirillum sp. TSO22-1]